MKPDPKQKTNRDSKYRAFIRKHPCLVCGRSGAIHHHEPLSGRGTGLKGNDNEAVPLCHEHHQERHQIGRKTFYQRYGINWVFHVAQYQAMYEATL